MSTHARPLADWLAAASDDDLAALFAARDIRADADWHDFFDAAEALLEAPSITRLLPRLTNAEAGALLDAASGADPGAERAALTALALLRSDGTPYPPVADAVLGRTLVRTPATSAPSPASADTAAHAAERAFTTVSTVADMLLLTRESPFSLLATGLLSSGDRRQLAESGVSAEHIDPLMSLMRDAGLAVAADRRLHTTAAAEDWLRSSVGERWTRLASGFRASLPRGVRRDGGWAPMAAWEHAHPWDPHWPQSHADLRERAQLLGLVADGTEPPWAEPLRTGAPADASALIDLLPAEVDRIFLQNDLSAISPGPLAPALDVRLRTMAARESAAQASSYRFSAESVAHALVLGETEESVLAFLEELSLTGVPQPLRYLVAQTAGRHGLVRVSTDAETGRTRIESADPHLLDAMAVDQSLRPLALTAHVASLTSRVGRDTVYWALTDARYPATLVADDGTVLSGERHPAAAPLGVAPDHTSLIAKLRAHRGPDADAAWLDRELEAAVRAKALLRVTVGMPDGSTRDLVLEATGLGGGRLRGRDRTADVERTLPVSSIRTATVVTTP